jgi:DNA-binding transcriptional LysR family regulator
MLSLSQFKQIVALSEHGSFTVAAEAVGLSHSALSQTLTRLEEHYGVLFFQRLGRTLLLTPAGRVFLQAARQSLAAFSDAESSLRAINEADNGRVVVAIDPVLRMFLPSDFCHLLRQANPTVGLELRYASWDVARVLVKKGQFNLWLGPEPENLEGLVEIYAQGTPSAGFFSVWDSQYAKGRYTIDALVGNAALAVPPLPRGFGAFLLERLPEEKHAGVTSRSVFDLVSDNIEDLICFARQPDQLSLIPLCVLPQRLQRKYGLTRVRVDDFPEASAGRMVLASLDGLPLDPSSEALLKPLVGILERLGEGDDEGAYSLAG